MPQGGGQQLTKGETTLADMLWDNNITYAQVIGATGMGSRTLSRYCNEAGHIISYQLLAKLCDLLDCDPDEISPTRIIE